MSLTVVITGAGSGFGKGAALALSARGHHVIATTETEAQAAALRAEAPQLQVEKLDITNASDIQKVNSWNIDVLLNNAGAGQTGPMADVPMDRVRFLFEVNVFGTIAITQAVLPQMVKRGKGRVIIVSSIAGVLAGPAFGPYSMTKHALEAFGKSLRAEMVAQGIDVTHNVKPGSVARYITSIPKRSSSSSGSGRRSLLSSGQRLNTAVIVMRALNFSAVITLNGVTSEPVPEDVGMQTSWALVPRVGTS
jgi:short-subunit dehydrogenase